ncbi:MAG: hypothetical protein COB15_15360 [Flavobacteriales bacterium]|nr:MAG: hypothetical protein COB15_15360 [Flavobacteriales bacterium]
MEDIRNKVELAVNTALEKGEKDGIILTDDSIVDEIVLALKADEDQRDLIKFEVMRVFFREGEISYLDIIDSVVESLKKPTDECPF